MASIPPFFIVRILLWKHGKNSQKIGTFFPTFTWPFIRNIGKRMALKECERCSLSADRGLNPTLWYVIISFDGEGLN